MGSRTTASTRSATASGEADERRRVEQDHELVAAEPADGVARAQDAFGCRARDGLQELVAGGVPERVVHALEAVEVEEERRHGRTLATRTRQQLLGAFEHQNPVRKPGQRIVESADDAAPPARGPGRAGRGAAAPAPAPARTIAITTIASPGKTASRRREKSSMPKPNATAEGGSHLTRSRVLSTDSTSSDARWVVPATAISASATTHAVSIGSPL